MEFMTKLSWVLLAIVHGAPASVVVAPGALSRLYGIEPRGDLGVLLTHRGALFLALAALSLLACFDAKARGAAAMAVGLSMISFLVLYVRAGAPPGALRTIALVDGVALAPWIVVVADVWRKGGT